MNRMKMRISVFRLGRGVGTVFLAAALLIVPVAAMAADFKSAVVALALWSDGSVFRSEAAGAAKIVADRYGNGGPVIVRSNTRKRLAAGPDGMMRALAAAERGMDPSRDVLILILTSHGSPEGIAQRGGGREGLLPPAGLREALSQSAFRRKVLIVSACYSGIFTPLAGPDTLVITAADAEHPSFGCEEGNRWTYFGEAFFNQALRRPGPLAQRFAEAQALIRAREQAQGFEPSNPQIAGGENILPLIDSAR